MLKKINTFILYILVFAIPFNIRYIFNFNKIKNIQTFREHLLIYINLFDILITILLILFLWDETKIIFKEKKWNKLFSNPLFYFFIWVIISLIVNNISLNNNLPNISHSLSWNLYKLIKLGELLIFFFISRRLLKQYTVVTYVKFIIFTSGFLQALIAILQFIFQKSIGLYWLGESIINPSVKGLARFSFESEKLIRAYGTFPHPNILGIFLLFSIASGFSLIINKQTTLTNLRWPYRLIFFLEFLVIYLGLFLTYSRMAIILTASLTILFFYQQKNTIVKSYHKLCQYFKIPFFLRTTLAIIIILSTLFGVYNLIAPRLCIQCPNDKSIQLRSLYRQVAVKTIIKKPFLGTGLGNSIPQTQPALENKVSLWRIQPVHNLYLLIATETGLIGLILFCTSIFFYLSTNFKLSFFKNHPLNIFFVLILIASFFDHYFWTIPQGEKIFWLSFALVSVIKKKKIDSPKYHFKYFLKNIRKTIKELSTKE